MAAANAAVDLQAKNLACRKGDRILFKGLNCSVSKGEILRISGGNGVGKTSLLRMLCGLVQPELGEVKWRGAHLHQKRESFLAKSVYMGHKPALSDQLTPLNNLIFNCVSSGDTVSRHDCLNALNKVGLKKQADLSVRVLSQGQRRRAALARLVLTSHRPLWILDEPFTALDTQAVNYLAQQLHNHTQSGGMVVVVTHHEIPFIQTPQLLNLEDWAC